MNKRVLVFGTFDGVHAGHEFFLRSAKARGTELVVGVARDDYVRTWKNRKPMMIQVQRLKTIQSLPYVDFAQLCDEQIGSFEIITHLQPDLIVLGHDQMELESSLIDWMKRSGQYVPMIKMKKYEARKRN